MAIAAAGAPHTYARTALSNRSFSEPYSSPCLFETAGGTKIGGISRQRRNISLMSMPIVSVKKSNASSAILNRLAMKLAATTFSPARAFSLQSLYSLRQYSTPSFSADPPSCRLGSKKSSRSGSGSSSQGWCRPRYLTSVHTSGNVRAIRNPSSKFRKRLSKKIAGRTVGNRWAPRRFVFCPGLLKARGHRTPPLRTKQYAVPEIHRKILESLGGVADRGTLRVECGESVGFARDRLNIFKQSEELFELVQ